MGGGGLWQRSGGELLRLLGECEARMRREYAVSVALISELDARDVVAEVGYPNLGALLRDVLRINTREANRRLDHSRAVTETPIVSGGTVPASLPVTGEALRDGAIGADHVTVIATALRDLPPHVPDADREFAEQTMVDAARELDATRLAKVGHRVRAWLDEDGAPPSDRELAEPMNELHLTTRANGRIAFRGELDREDSALLLSVISPLAAPRPSSATGPDPRSAAERNGDAFVEILHLAADTGALPTEAGERPHILVTVPLHALTSAAAHPHDLDSSRGGRPTSVNSSCCGVPHHAAPLDAEIRDGTTPRDAALDNVRGGTPGHNATLDVATLNGTALDGTASKGYPGGTSSHAAVLGTALDGAALDGMGNGGFRGCTRRRAIITGAILDGIGHLDAESARRLACDAKVIPAVLGGRSEPLDLGRASYTVSTALRRALVLRDGGCAFPGCDRSQRWCHSHHIEHWADGGTTEPDNLVLLCGQHHRLVHHSDWECAIVHGRPQFRPPGFIDPDRKPRHNLLHAS